MMDADTRALLTASLRHTLTETATQPLAQRLQELGWDDVLADDEPGALGLLFGLKGDTVASADALGPVLAARLAEVAGDPALRSAVVALPGLSTVTTGTDGVMQLLAVTAAPIGTAPIGVDAQLAVVAGDHGAERIALIAPGPWLVSAPGHGVDATLALQNIAGSVSAEHVRWLDPAAATAVLTTARALLATELVGLAAHVITSAVAYTGQRVQYGKAIGTFQALQHRLAAAHALVVGAGHLADEARRTSDPWTALVAKAMAGQAAENACVQAQQCYGAIGFTWEHEFHHYLKRAYALDWMAGDWRTLERRIGATLQSTRRVPHIGAL